MTLESGAGREQVSGGISPVSCLVPGLLIAVAIAVGGGLTLINCLRASEATSFTSRIDALPPETPVFLSGPGVYLVRLPDGVVALDQNEFTREDRLKNCYIRWREALEREGTRGFFRSDCNGTLYDRRGLPAEGGGLPMKRHPVAVDGGKVRVDLQTCTSPGEGNRVVPCKPG